MYRYMRLLSCVCVGVALVATSVHAQTPQRSPKEIGQIVDAAVQAVIPSWERHAHSTIAERGVRFDFARTMAAFGYADNARARASLGMTLALTAGSDSLLVDCDQMGSKPCSRLGQSVYMYLEPISVSTSEVALWVHVVWAGTPPKSKRTFRASSSTEVFLSRSGSGPWTLVRLGRGLIS
jgi:hypothetical protein